MAPVVVYTFARSAPCRSVVMVCRNLDLDIELREIDLFSKEQLKPEYVKVNPQHTVPCIDDDGFILWESRAIGQYLSETKVPGNTLFPSDPKEKALCNQRLYFDAVTFYPRIRNICYPVLFLGETKISEDKRRDLAAAFNFMETFLEGKKWFCGDKLTIADIAILASLLSIIHVGADISEYKNLSAWFEQCKKLPGFDENDKEAKMFGDSVKSKLQDSF